MEKKQKSVVSLFALVIQIYSAVKYSCHIHFEVNNFVCGKSVFCYLIHLSYMQVTNEFYRLLDSMFSSLLHKLWSFQMSFIYFQSDYSQIKGRNPSHLIPCVNIFITNHGLAFVVSINKLMLAMFDTTGVNIFSPFLLNSIKIILRIVHRKIIYHLGFSY